MKIKGQVLPVKWMWKFEDSVEYSDSPALVLCVAIVSVFVFVGV